MIKVLIFLAYYLPGYKSGGPIRTIANMVETLGDEFEFHIVTSDRDLGDEVPYSGINANTWNQAEKAKVYYSSPSKRSFSLWRRLINETPHKILYLNSLFSPIFTLLPLLIRKWSKIAPKNPIIIAPRGELSPGALQIKKHKKMFFLRFAKALNLYADVFWQASSLDEKNYIIAMFGEKSRIYIARDLPESIPSLQFFTPHQNSPERLRVIFISRISRKKNLDFALRILAQSHLSIEFDIWGPLEDRAYWNECQTLIESLPDTIQARYRGLLDHAQVNNTLAQYDLFFLPTRGENYGHVIAEALSAGTPVLISDQTPWHDLECAGVGWDLALSDEPSFVDALNFALERVQRDRLSWRRQVHDYAVNQLTDPELIEANRQLFYRASKQAQLNS